MATKTARKRAKDVPAKRPGFDITIEGFKSISRKETLTFRPLTVLSGSNSSGKSSFMQPLLMLKQTLEAPYDPGALLINGPHAKFTSTQQFLAEGTGAQRTQRLSVGYSHANANILLNFTRKGENKPIELSQQTITTGKITFSMEPGHTYKSPFSDLPDNVRDYLKIFFPPSYKDAHLTVMRDRCFLNLGLETRAGDLTPLPLTQRLLGDFPQLLRTMIHLPGLRGNPERTYPLSAVGKTFPGPFQSYAASIIDSWQEQSSPPLGTLNQYLQELNLASQIVTRKIDETQVELRVNRISSDTASFVSIADVGMAVSQILPVLVALAAAEAGQVVFIEQPELHLHPRAQLSLARILCAAVERGITLVLETHSSLLILGIQTCIADGVVDADDVALHWFTRDQEGVTCVESATLEKSGSFGDWPEDFGDVSLEAESQYLSAAERAYARDLR
jgi:predicted ATPase